MLMLHATVARCPDCADECVLLPTDGFDGFCCTSCDAAVFLLEAPQPALTKRLAG